MKKFWIVYCLKNDDALACCETYDGAELLAKRLAATDPQYDYYILETVAVVRQPIPNVEIVSLKENIPGHGHG